MQADGSDAAESNFFPVRLVSSRFSRVFGERKPVIDVTVPLPGYFREWADAT